MFKSKKSTKITKYKKNSFFNIGTLFFGIVFVYMVICIFMYLTETHITSYEVTRGSITGNYRFHAFSLRSETIVNASQSGAVRYYVREGARASAGSAVCSVNTSNTTAPVSYSTFSMSSEEAARIQSLLSSFTINFDSNAFQSTYDTKSNVQTALAEILQGLEEAPAYVQNQCTAPASGFILYSTDGYESMTEAQITSELFDQSSYHVTSLRQNASVTAGNPVFKEVTSEDWALYFPMSEKLHTELADASSIQFRFLKDNVTFTAPFSIIQNGQEYFGKISMSNSLVRYATDRYLEIELIMNKKVGLKIPESAIVQRDFYAIPEEYVIKNEGTDSEITLKVETSTEDGSAKTEYLTANVYKYDSEAKTYLIDRQLLSVGDVILMDDSAKRMQLQEKDEETLYGVYNINKGYAVFREITIIDENEEYCIVESNNTYGLAAHDYIVLRSDEVTEDQIVY